MSDWVKVLLTLNPQLAKVLKAEADQQGRTRQAVAVAVLSEHFGISAETRSVGRPPKAPDGASCE